MSCYYRALPKLIPELVLLAGRSAEIALVSPWIENVLLLPPKFGVGVAGYEFSMISLREFLLRITRDFDMRVILLVREKDRRLHSALDDALASVPNNILVRVVPHIHAKMIVTSMFAIETSANILQTSLFRNIESCTLVRNPFGNTRQYLRDKLGLVI